MKKLLWIVKLLFIIVCLFLWILIIKWGSVIFPTFMKQCKYHKAGEQYLEEKYGEKIALHNGRLPLTELNTASYSEYEFSFEIEGTGYSLVYYEDYDYFCDNLQADKIYNAMQENLEEFLDNIEECNEIGILSSYDWEFCPEWWLKGKIDCRSSLKWHRNNEERLYNCYYTGDNLESYPIYLYLYYENVEGATEQELHSLYEDVIKQLNKYGISTEKIEILYRKNEQADWGSVIFTS